MTTAAVDPATTGWLPRRRRGLLLTFLGLGLLDVVASGLDLRWLDYVTKPLLVPVLLAWVVLETRPVAPRLLVAGLVLAWLGDVALMFDGDLAFMVGIGFFLGMQLCYITGFVRLGALFVFRGRWWVPVGFGLVWVGLNAVLGPQLGELRWPLAVYSLALATMAAMAVGVNAQVALGGALFFVSDLLIGLGAADLDVPASGVLVMTTYVLAQYLIATGWVARLQVGRLG